MAQDLRRRLTPTVIMQPGWRRAVCHHLPFRVGNDRVTFVMRRDLDHLPANKRRELERVLQLIFEEFEDVTACASEARRKAGRIHKIILYGSYARGCQAK